MSDGGRIGAGMVDRDCSAGDFVKRETLSFPSDTERMASPGQPGQSQTLHREASWCPVWCPHGLSKCSLCSGVNPALQSTSCMTHLTSLTGALCVPLFPSIQ